MYYDTYFILCCDYIIKTQFTHINKTQTNKYNNKRELCSLSVANPLVRAPNVVSECSKSTILINVSFAH